MEGALLEAKLDFGFTDRKTNRSDIIQHPLVQSELCLFVSKKVSERSLKEYLSDLPLVVCRGDRNGPSSVEEMLESVGFTSSNIIVADYPSLVEFLCREGSAVAVLGRAHFKNDPTMRMLDLPLEIPPLVERLYVSWALDSENSEAIIRLRKTLETPR